MRLASTPDERSGTHDLPAGQALRVLVVDDDEEDAMLVRDLLEASEGASDWEVEWRPTAEEGLDALRSQSFHVCLVDYRLGRESGLALIEAAHDEDSPVPLILLTGDGSRDVDLAAMRAGASDFLSKENLDAPSLERAIRYAVEEARVRCRLLRLARRDPLTGLHNRGSIEEHIASARSRAERSGQMFGVCIVDLDGFKAVNDRLGHAAGDELLRIVGQRLKKAVRPYDTVGRLGGDEFAVLLEDLDSEAEATQIAERLVSAIRPPFELSLPVPPVSASVGLAIYPTAGCTAVELLQMADAAMYAAKRRGKARAAMLTPTSAGRAALPRTGEEVLAAARAGDLDIAFQPQVDLRTGKPVGVEALARWAPRERGTVDTEWLVSELERSGAVAELDLWMLEQATRKLADRALGLPSISVNMSPLTLASPGFLARVSRLLPAEPGLVELELTETALGREAFPTSNILHVLRALGFRVALDDFGLGQASLRRLRDLPVDTLKINRTFVHGMDFGLRDAAIVEAVALLGEKAGVDVVAEGIETEAQASRLVDLGLTKGQGFLYARPLLEEELVGWMSAQHPNG